jgi:hypothetical protein
VVQDGRPEPVPSGVLAGNRRLSPVEQDLGALGLRAFDGRHQACPCRGVDQRAHARPERDLLRDRLDVADEALGATDGDHQAARHAALPGAAGERVHDRAHRERRIRVGGYDQLVLGAAQTERALACGRCLSVHVPRHLR